MLTSLIVLSALASYILTIIFPIETTLIFWIYTGFNIILLIVAIILSTISLNLKKDLVKDIVEIKFNYKSLDDWIEVLKPGAILLLFSFTSAYILLESARKLTPAVDFVMLPATLGGLTLAASAFQNISERLKNPLLQIAKLFILATFFTLLFYIAYVLLSATPDFNPNHYTNIDYRWIANEIIFYIVVIGLFGGAYTFSKAIVDLVALLRKDTWWIIIEK